MKKTLIIVAGITLITAACSRKMAPSATTKTEQTQPAAINDTATIATGHALYESRCGTCHGLKKVEKYSVTEWEHILKSMAPKAKLTDVETQQVTAYVNANAKK
jgi:mono/diheme cytochrome c family protein